MIIAGTTVIADDHDDQGFTLAEVIVAMGILFVVAVSATALVINLMRTASTTQYRVTATNIAEQDLQKMRALNTPTTADQIVSATTAQKVGALEYEIHRTVTLVPSTSPCSTGGYRIVQTTVTPHNNARSVTLTTRIAC